MSNALERSIKTESVYSPFSKEPYLSLLSSSMACSVKYFFENKIVFHIEGL